VINRATFLRIVSALPLVPTRGGAETPNAVERWGVFEASFKGPTSGNPFRELNIGASFRFGHRTVEVNGFYDGSGDYRVRFMPDEVGDWSYVTKSNRPELGGQSGKFTCVPNSPANHGPVRVKNTYHFSYEDGAPYLPFGTTAYAWAHQGSKLEGQTLETLRRGPFNKMRMCVFPKSYVYNTNEPPYYPFPRDASGQNDFSRFNPDFFRHFEGRIRDLLNLGIEADLILFHPYDRWGYQSMPAEVDDQYLRYLIARMSAFRNIWWSMANEWDFMKSKSLSDFDRFFRIVQEADPYGHLRSIHNGTILYDHSRPWVTHASIQGDDFAKAPGYREDYKKPVVWDECKYEGNIQRRWGNISAEEMTYRFWRGVTDGTYVGHGETYLDSADVLWWSKGGILHGQSPKRIEFVRRLLETHAPDGLYPLANQKYAAASTRDGRFYLYYFDLNQPAEMEFELPKNASFQARLLDPWNMTSTPVAGEHSGHFTLKLSGKPYQAVSFEKKA
jgi:hypothetical protein